MIAPAAATDNFFFFVLFPFCGGEWFDLRVEPVYIDAELPRTVGFFIVEAELAEAGLIYLKF